MHVFFFRGISTAGRDELTWSIFNFGSASKHLERELASRGVILHPVLGMGEVPIPDMAERARRFLEQHPLWKDRKQKVHLIGHSAGGLISRLVLAALKRDGSPLEEKVASHLTIASPHHGSALARLALEMPERHPGSARLLRTFGYSLSARADFFRMMTAESIARLMTETDRPYAIREGSIVCHLPRAQWCLPLRAIYRVKALREFSQPSDGFVERDSQIYRTVVAEVPLDHFQQVGLFGRPPAFYRLCDEIARFVGRAHIT